MLKVNLGKFFSECCTACFRIAFATVTPFQRKELCIVLLYHPRALLHLRITFTEKQNVLQMPINGEILTSILIPQLILTIHVVFLKKN